MDAAMRAAAAVAMVLIISTAAGAQYAPEPEPRDVTPVADMLAASPRTTIASGDLRVTIALPDAKRGFYRNTRFDWSGMITEVSRGKSKFYGSWHDGVAPNLNDYTDISRGVFASPRSSAIGPTEEFINREGENVLGYDAAKPGDTFVKIGVGRLRKPDMSAYVDSNPYDMVDGGQWSVRRKSNRVVFTQRLEPGAEGYGYLYEKTVSVAPGGVMTIAHRLRNLGPKAIHTQVYNHNFARFDGAEIGPGVRAKFPFPIKGPIIDPDLAEVKGLAVIDGSEFGYLRSFAPGEVAEVSSQGGPNYPSGPFVVTGANGASISMQADVPLVRSVLWSIRRTVAVVPFIALDIEPGAEQRWSWRYTYTAGK